MELTRRGFLTATTVGGAVALGFDVTQARAEMRELKISRTTETRSICPYCAVSCGVIIHTIGDGSNRDQLIHHRGHARQVLADLDARNVRFDGFKFAADFRRCIQFDIEHVLVRGASRQINHDDRLLGLANARLGFRLEQLRQRKPAQSQGADL